MIGRTTGFEPVHKRAARPGQPRFVRRGFTLIELMVSIAVLLVLMSMVGWIFKTATGASGVATSSNELNGSMRAINQRFDLDFSGLDKSSFIGIWYQLTKVPDTVDPAQPHFIRTDRMVFFSAGDFNSSVQTWDLQSQELWPPSSVNFTANRQSVRSNMAHVFLGHYYAMCPLDGTTQVDDYRRWMLGRRARLLASPGSVKTAYISTANDWAEDRMELDTNGTLERDLANWKNDLATAVTPLPWVFNANTGWMSETAKGGWMRRPRIDPQRAEPNGVPLLMSNGCAEFKIQRWIERSPIDGTQLGPYAASMPRWWPEDDLDGDGVADDPATAAAVKTDFSTTATGSATTSIHSSPKTFDLLEYYNGPNLAAYKTVTGVHQLITTTNSNSPWVYQNGANTWVCRSPEDMPKAIKITIRLYDANGRLADGQVYTMTYVLR